MKNKLPIGTKLYFVIESICDHSFRDEKYHFEIISGEITGINEFIGSREDEYRVPTKNRFGIGSCLEYPRCKDVGKGCFLTYQEAVESAERITDKYEKHWAYLEPEKLERPWRES